MPSVDAFDSSVRFRQIILDVQVHTFHWLLTTELMIVDTIHAIFDIGVEIYIRFDLNCDFIK